jgi:hypothetical protein
MAIAYLFRKMSGFIFWPVILWKSHDQTEGKFTSIIGLVSVTVFVWMFFEKDPIFRFACGFAGGILFYVGYLLKRAILGDE